MPAWTIPYSSAAQSVSDPYIANVVLLLHGEGSTIVDSSLSSHTPTANGTVATSATQAMFGSKSIYFDGTAGNSLELGTSIDWAWGADEWTVELFMYAGANSTTRTIWDNRNSVSGGIGILYGVVPNTLRVYWYQYLSGSSFLTSSVALTASTQTHIAVCRSGSNLYLFQAGALVASDANFIVASDTSAKSATLGAADGTTSSRYIGYLDEVRVTKGTARYTSAFTPPTAAFPDP